MKRILIAAAVLALAAVALTAFQPILFDDLVWFRMRSSAPASPSAGFAALSVNSTTGALQCVKPDGSSCMPAGGAAASIDGNYAAITGTACNSGSNGLLGFPDPGTSIYEQMRCKNGPGWFGAFGGGMLPVWDATGWTQENPGSATFVTSGGGLVITTGPTTDHLRGVFRAALATPWSAMVRLQYNGPGDGHGGIYGRNGTDNAVHTYHWYTDAGNTINHKLRVVTYTGKAPFSGVTTISADVGGNAASGKSIDLCLTDDGTNAIFSFSKNGVDWTPQVTQSRTTVTAMTGWGVYAARGGTANVDTKATFAHWKVNPSATCGW